MKKLIIGVLVLCSLFVLCSCVGETEESSNAPVSSVAVSSEAESEAASSEASESTSVFEVTVVDGEGNKISGVMLQVCKDACMPARTDESGVATFNLEITDGYKLSVMSCPEGYKYTGEAEIYLESGITEYTLTIEKDAE
ncbi:MAG: hypothetical protein IJB49_09670 [Clostridia bacterium]|nr:hypothetical protein [Clostridia bacterium]